MKASILLVTYDAQLKEQLAQAVQNSNIVLCIEQEIIKALLVALENRPVVIIVDLSIGREVVIHMIDIINKSNLDAPAIVVHEEENSIVLGELFQKKILCRFRRPLSSDSLIQLKKIIDNRLEKRRSNLKEEINSSEQV